MSASPARPDEATLRRFLTGTLDPEGMDLVADYLDEHPEALSTLNALAAADTLVSALRGAGETADPSELRQLIDRLRRRPAPRADATEELAAPGRRGDDTEAAAEEDDPAEAMRQLLTPAEGSDELGRLAGYRVLRLLGHGGMGLVFEAEDVHLRRRVALKAMQPRLARSAAARARFLREARAMAAVTHDHIMPVYQVGEDRGVPFLAMPLLEGSSLEGLLSGGPLPVAQVLRLGRQVALGLAAAHGRGLIHRDVKPGNIWVEKASERVKLLDFGLARPMGEEQGLTRSGTVVGTPAYMAPEQARGLAIDGRADLFGLGCVLYRMTTGRPAFAGSDTFAILTSLAVDTPPAPATLNPAVPAALSTLIMRLLEKDPARRPASADAVATELERIAPSAVATPAVPTSVATPSPDETTSLPAAPVPVRRRPRAALLVAAAVLLLAGGGLLLAPLILRLTTPNGELVVTVDDPNLEVVVKQDGAVVRDRTKARSFVLTAGRDGQIEFFDPETGVRVLTKTFTIERGRKTVVEATVRERAAAKTPEQRPSPGPLDGLKRQDIPAEELALAGGGDPAQAPAELVAVLGTGRTRHWGQVFSMRFSDDGKHLLSASVADGTIRLWDVSNGRQVQAVSWPEWTLVGLAVRGADTPRIATVPFGPGRPAEGVKEIQSILHQGVDVNPQGGWAVGRFSGGHDTLKRLDLTTGKEELLLKREGHDLMSTAISPDGTLVAVAWRETEGGVATGKQEVYDLATGKVRHTLRMAKAIGADLVAFTPDGKQLVAGCGDGTVRFRDALTGEDRRTLTIEHRPVTCLTLSRDGKRLATTGEGSHVQLWDLTSGKVTHALPLVSGGSGLPRLAFSPDGGTLAAASTCGAIQLFDTATGRERRMGNAPRSFAGMALSRDGRTLAAGTTEGPVMMYDLTSSRPSGTLRLDDPPYPGMGRFRRRAVAVTPDGRTVATPWPHDTLRFWDVASGKVRRSLPPWVGFTDAAFSPAGTRFAGFHVWGRLGVWGDRDEKPLWTWTSDRGELEALAYAPDGRSIAVQGRKGGDGGDVWVLLFNAATGEPGRLFTAAGEGREPIGCVAFSPDGSLLAVPVGDRRATTVLLWDVATGEERLRLKGAAGAVVGIAFHPGGKQVAGIGLDGTVRLWDLAGPADPSRPVRTIRVGPPTVNALQIAFAPDGRHLLTLNGNGTIYVLRLDQTVAPPPPPAPAVSPLDGLEREAIPAEELALAGGGDPARAPAELVAVVGTGRLRHWHRVEGLAFTPDGKYLLSGSGGESVCLWDAETGEQLRAVPAATAAVYSVVPQGDLRPRLTVRLYNQDKSVGREAGAVRTVSLRPTEVLSPDRKLLAGGPNNANEVTLWDLTTGKSERMVQRMQHNLTSVAFSPDGARLAVAWQCSDGSAPHSIDLYDVAARRLHRTLTLKGKGWPRQVVFTPGGSTLVACDQDGFVRLWDPASGDERRVFPRQNGILEALALSGDGKLLATAQHGSLVHLWDLATGQILRTIDTGLHGNHALAISPDRSTLATGSQRGVIRLWDVASGTEKRRQGDGGFPVTIALASDGRTLAVADSEGTVSLRDLATGRRARTIGVDSPIRQPRIEDLRPLAFSADGKTLAAGGPDNTLRLWEVATGEERARWRHPNVVGGVAFRPDGRAVATVTRFGDQGYLTLWDVEQGATRQVWHEKGQSTDSVAFSPDGKTLAVRGASGEKGWVGLFDPETGTPGRRFPDPVSPAGGPPVFSPDGRLLAAPTGMHTPVSVVIRETATGKERFSLKLPPLPAGLDNKSWTRAVAFSPDGKQLASAGFDAKVRLWDLTTPEDRARLVRTIPLGPDGGCVRQVFFTPDGRHLITLNGNGTVYVLRLDPTEATGVKPLAPAEQGPETTEPLSPEALVGRPTKLPGVTSWTLETVRHRGAVTAVAFSPKGEWLASGGDDGAVRVWNARTAELHRLLVRHPERIDHLAWSPDGRYLASTSNGERQTTCVWQIEGWRLLRTLPAASYAVAWSADSQDLAVQGEGGSLRFFTILDGKEVRSIRDAGPVWRMDRAPDGKTLAAIRQGGSTVLRWDAGGKPLPPLSGEAAGFQALARAPDGSRLAAGGGDRKVRIWDDAGKLLHTCTSSDTVNALAWSPDSTLVASLGTVTEIWQVADGKKVATIPFGGQALAWSADGNRLAVGGQDGTIVLFDRTGKAEHTLRGHQTVPTRGTLSPDGKRLALTYWLPKIWDEDRRTLIACGDLPAHAYAWSPDGSTLAMSRERDTVLLDGKTGEETAVLERGKPHGALAWSGDGKSLAVCGNDHSLRVWDVRARRSLQDIPGIPKHAAPRQVVAWTPDGRTVSYASGSHVLNCVEVATGRTRTTEGADVDLVTAAAPAPDGKAVAVGYVHGAIRLHDPSLKRIEEVKTGVRVEGLVWLPGGRQLACVLANDTVRVWDLANGTLGKETPRFAWSGPVSGSLMASDCRGGLVCWDVSTGRRQGALLILDSSRVVVLGPEGHWHSDGVAVEMHLVYVVATEKGQELLTPPEFARRFGFQNDPGKARLLPR